VEYATDLIGPWTIQVRGNPYEFEALTVIDTVTNLIKLVRIDDKRSQTVARKLAQCWLTRYPWPQRCVHDPGTEFTGPEFQRLLQNYHIRDICTTAKNPQSNAVCERMIHNRNYPKDTFPNTWGHIAKYMGTHCQIHGDTFPNTWGNIA
jgi:transposase InsO family protein